VRKAERDACETNKQEHKQTKGQRDRENIQSEKHVASAGENERCSARCLVRRKKIGRKNGNENEIKQTTNDVRKCLDEGKRI